jgi:hypothetical protein
MGAVYTQAAGVIAIACKLVMHHNTDSPISISQQETRMPIR